MFEAPKKEDDWKVDEKDGPDWKQIKIEPPPKPEKRMKLVEISKLPPWTH